MLCNGFVRRGSLASAHTSRRNYKHICNRHNLRQLFGYIISLGATRIHIQTTHVILSSDMFKMARKMVLKLSIIMVIKWCVRLSFHPNYSTPREAGSRYTLTAIACIIKVLFCQMAKCALSTSGAVWYSVMGPIKCCCS